MHATLFARKYKIIQICKMLKYLIAQKKKWVKDKIWLKSITVKWKQLGVIPHEICRSMAPSKSVKIGILFIFGGWVKMGQKKLSWNFQNYRLNSLGDIKILIYFLVILPWTEKKNTFFGFSLIATYFVIRMLWDLNQST